MKLFANWSYPTAIRFGQGRINELAQACQDLNIKRPLLVTDRGLASTDMVKSTLANLKQSGLEATLFADIDPNPTQHNLSVGLAAYKERGCDGSIAFGGGSALDLGKLLAFMIGQTRPIWDFEDIDDWWQRADASAIHKIIAVPTTAGTGSETGRGAVITNTESLTKTIIFHPQLMPSIVICDPQLTVSMPKSITAGTGLDAFAHCLEAYCSPNYHPLSHGVAVEGLRLVKEYLPRAYADGTDLEARANMMTAAICGSTAFQKGLGAIHSLSHPIGALYHAHHGTTNAVVMPHVLKFNRSKIESSINRLAGYLDIKGGFDGFYEYVTQQNHRLNIPRTLTELGVNDPNLEQLTQMALDDPSTASNPLEMNHDNTLELFKACL